jgi:integrase
VVELVTGIVQRGAPATANKTFKAVRALFNWCVGQALLERSPCEALRLPARDVARERVLSDEELAAVLARRAGSGVAYGGIVELLALTAQRREEVARMTWAEVDSERRLWALAGSRTKNGRAHQVHLSDQAWVVLERMPRSAEHVFVQGAEALHRFQPS